jgi:hypothetical protein
MIHLLRLVSLLCVLTFGWAHDDDRFNYNSTRIRESGAIDFGPKEWANLDCLGNDNIENCVSQRIASTLDETKSHANISAFYSWATPTSGN